MPKSSTPLPNRQATENRRFYAGMVVIGIGFAIGIDSLSQLTNRRFPPSLELRRDLVADFFEALPGAGLSRDPVGFDKTELLRLRGKSVIICTE